MKTTLNIDDGIYKQIKMRAAKQSCTVSELVETGLRMLLEQQESSPKELPPLPTFEGRRVLVDVADRDALYRAMDGR